MRAFRILKKILSVSIILGTILTLSVSAGARELKKITSVSDTFTITDEGKSPELQKYVRVNFDDGSSKFMRVNWDEISEEQYKTPGVFKVHGTLKGMPEPEYGTDCTVFVLSETKENAETEGSGLSDAAAKKREESFSIIRDDVFRYANTVTANNTLYDPNHEIINQIYNLIASYGINCGFYMIDLDSYATIGYNAESDFDTASTIKAPYCLYLMKEINKGNKSLSDILTYQERFWEISSGVIKFSTPGTQFTVEEVMNYTINISDNTGYYMLKDYGGYEGYNQMLTELGCKTWLSGGINWGKFTPHDLGVIWNEIYNFSMECEEGQYLMNLLINAKYGFIKDGLKKYDKVAHKSGFNDHGYHDAAIIFDENGEAKYIMVIMTQTITQATNKVFLAKLAVKLDELMADFYAYQESLNNK